MYAVDSTRVADQLATFPDHVRRSWQAFLAIVLDDPHPRFGVFVDRIVPILGFRMRTWIYEIVEEASISGLAVFVFTGDFFPEYAPVYMVNDERQEVIILYLRDNSRY